MTDTDEETETGSPIARMNDEAIACRLRAGRFITGSAFDAFMRRKNGETFQHIAETGPINPFTSKRYDRSAIEDWVRYVAEQIAIARKIDLPVERDPSVWGHWIAEGHIVRLAADNTPKMCERGKDDREPGSHFPDAERMKASGKKPR